MECGWTGGAREVEGQRLWNWFRFLYVSDVLRLPTPLRCHCSRGLGLPSLNLICFAIVLWISSFRQMPEDQSFNSIADV